MPLHTQLHRIRIRAFLHVPEQPGADTSERSKRFFLLTDPVNFCTCSHASALLRSSRPVRTAAGAAVATCT